MKYFVLLLLICCFSAASSQRILQILRILSGECNNQGFLYKNQCFCHSQWTGPTCSIQQEATRSDDTTTQCDDLSIRLDYLSNISPTFYLFDDDEFPRLTVNSIDGSSPGNPALWTKMHDLIPNFHIFSRKISALDIGQGKLGDCYLLSAYASLANRLNGSVLRNMFVEIEDNKNHVYTTRWMVNGKPRYVAVDDWIPGGKSYSSYSQIQQNGDAWPLILEKAFAKIHGNYKIIEGGLQSTVWTAITQAPSNYMKTNAFTAETLFSNLTSFFKNNYVVGCGTGDVSLEVKNHAYSVLGAHEVTLDNGTRVNLIRYYNPWHSEVWATNPWDERSEIWTPKVISQVPYQNGNDGITFSTVPDFMNNFGSVQWAEVRDNYDVSFIDLSLNFDDKLFHPFKFNFTYFGEEGNDIYIFVDQSDGLITGSCRTPVFVSSLIVTQFSNGNVYKPTYINQPSLKISNASNGTYKININAAKNHSTIKYFTVTSYSQAGSINFIPPSTTTTASYEANCPNSCSLQGRCNTNTGTCTCYFGYTENDCSKIDSKNCKDCSSPAICDTIFGICLKPALYNVGKNQFAAPNSKWQFQLGETPESMVYYPGNASIYLPFYNQFMTFSGTTFFGASIMRFYLQLNSPSQKWDKIFISNENFVLISGLNANVALALNLRTSKLTTEKLNKTNLYQQWKFVIKYSDCLNNCSGRGVCSYSTGKCICGTGYVGAACEFVDAPVECPNNCSGRGSCSKAAGSCNCQADYVGQSCNVLYRDLICPQNCSYKLDLGNCNEALGYCVCSNGFTGPSCKQFDGLFNYTIFNANNSQYLSFDSDNSIVTSETATKWTIPSDNKIFYLDGRTLSLYGTVESLPKISFIKFYSAPIDFQYWQVEKIKNYYVIRTNSDLNYVISLEKTKVTVKPYNADDTTQIWYISQA